LRGHAELREALGSEVLMHFSVSARAAVTEEVRELAEDVGDDRATKQLASDERATLVGRFSPATRIREGDTIDVAVDESCTSSTPPRAKRSTTTPQIESPCRSRLASSRWRGLRIALAPSDSD
jgi:hypothetical protein